MVQDQNQVQDLVQDLVRLGVGPGDQVQNMVQDQNQVQDLVDCV
jgi:hypothetical protein